MKYERASQYIATQYPLQLLFSASKIMSLVYNSSKNEQDLLSALDYLIEFEYRQGLKCK